MQMLCRAQESNPREEFVPQEKLELQGMHLVLVRTLDGTHCDELFNILYYNMDNTLR